MPRKPKAAPGKTAISAVKHKDKRTNIPTQELRDFVRDEEVAPKTILYPRDPSLDPQLVWKGKDAADRSDLGDRAPGDGITRGPVVAARQVPDDLHRPAVRAAHPPDPARRRSPRYSNAGSPNRCRSSRSRPAIG